MALFRNVQHGQVARRPVSPAEPTFVDISGFTEVNPNTSAESTDVYADGTTYASIFDAPTGSGDFRYVESDFAVNVIVNGGAETSSGTTPSVIKRWEQPAESLNPAFILSTFMPNVRTESQSAGMRLTLPNCTAGPVNISGSQRNVGEWNTPIRYTKDPVTGYLVIYEDLESAPTFTSGVMPVNLERPTP